MLLRSQDNNSMSREEYWDDYSDDSEYSRERRGDLKHNRGTMAQSREERYSKVLLHKQRRRKKILCKKHWKQR
jgi:hypothetical protein